MDRNASARWTGDLRSGAGTVRLGSGAFEGPYSFRTRFESEPGTNPEELLAAAHAGCFTMALSLGLTKAGHPPRSLESTAVVHLNKVGEGFGITAIDLTTRGVVPGISEGEFQRLALDAKVNCIISKAVAGVPVALTATLIHG
jgi:osmotically inducible protein OsmC